jgi:hypothetical protein
VYRILLYPVIVLAFVLGCGEQPSPTSLADELPVPSLSVERGTAPVSSIGFFGFHDLPFRLFIGVTVENLLDGVCTGTPFDTARVNQLVVTRPDGSMKQQLKGRVNVVVVKGVSGLQSFCEDPSAASIYTGTARLLLNDSDVDLSGRGADAVQIHVVGTVSSENGRRYHLVGFNQGVVAPEFTSTDNFFSFRHDVAKIKLTPLGR